MCENFSSRMPTLPPQSLARRKALVLLLLLVIAAAVAYTIAQNRPWTVPEEAKRRANPVPPSDEALNAIRPVYREKCASCHGDLGKGDGHDAKRYEPRPTDFSDTNQLRRVTDGELFYKISEGHRPMPSFKKRLSEEQRWQLVLFIRSFAASSPSALGTSPAPSSNR
jgi:mono/diheme cytochrome c family protein